MTPHPGKRTAPDPAKAAQDTRKGAIFSREGFARAARVAGAAAWARDRQPQESLADLLWTSLHTGLIQAEALAEEPPDRRGQRVTRIAEAADDRRPAGAQDLRHLHIRRPLQA